MTKINFKLVYINDIPFVSVAEVLAYLNIHGNKTDVELFIKDLIPLLVESNENHKHRGL